MKYLVIDPSGLFTEHAAGLCKGGNKVKFWTQFNYAFHDYAIGLDYKGLEKVLYWAEHVEWADCIVGFDVRLQDVIGFLRDQYPNKSVFGSGWAGKIEDDRMLLKNFVLILFLGIRFVTQMRLERIQERIFTKRLALKWMEYCATDTSSMGIMWIL